MVIYEFHCVLQIVDDQKKMKLTTRLRGEVVKHPSPSYDLLLRKNNECCVFLIFIDTSTFITHTTSLKIIIVLVPTIIDLNFIHNEFSVLISQHSSSTEQLLRFIILFRTI